MADENRRQISVGWLGMTVALAVRVLTSSAAEPYASDLRRRLAWRNRLSGLEVS